MTIGPDVTADDDLLSMLLPVSTAHSLLVVADYDGTLAEIVADPAQAHPDEESLRLLAELASLHRTHCAVVSGRSRSDLVRFTRLPASVHLVGSHGSEFDADWAEQLPSSVSDLRHRISAELEPLVTVVPGAHLEHKPVSVAVHLRRVSELRRAELAADVIAVAQRLDGVSVKHGKLVIELCALATDKGTATQRLVRMVRPDAVLFVGDDDTDEDAFVVLRPQDLGVKVGPGATRARARVSDPTAVELLLAHVLEVRTAALGT